jgi:hypothetical protein
VRLTSADVVRPGPAAEVAPLPAAEVAPLPAAEVAPLPAAGVDRPTSAGVVVRRAGDDFPAGGAPFRPLRPDPGGAARPPAGWGAGGSGSG